MAWEKEGRREMIKERRKTARGEAAIKRWREGGRTGEEGMGVEKGREERASVSIPCVKRADGNRG